MKKKKGLGLLVLLLLVGVAGVFVVGTYAKYTGSVDKTGTAYIAKWAFSTDNTSGDLTINLAQAYDASTLVSTKTVGDKTYKVIAPGTSGSFDLVITNTNSEVGIDYEITFTDIAHLPTYLVFKQNGTAVDITTKKITGTLPAGQTATIPMTWEWPYESGTNTSGVYSGDATDTSEGSDTDANRTMTFNAHVVAKQTQPSTTAIDNTFSIVNIGS